MLPATLAPPALLVRHTRVEAPDLCYGQTDAVPLAATFAAEAAAVRAALLTALAPTLAGWPKNTPGRVQLWRSPAARCGALADELARTLPAALPPGLTLECPPPDPRLHELHFGTWENRPWDSLPPAELDPWMADFVTVAPPGGESFRALAARAEAWRAAVTAAGGAHGDVVAVVAVTHAGVIRALGCARAGVPLAEAFARFAEVPYGAVVAR